MISLYFVHEAWFPLVLRIVRIGDFYDINTSGILTTSGNTSSQKSQTVGDFYDVIGRIGIISTLKVLSQTSQASAIFTMSVNLAVLKIAIIVRIPVSGNSKNPRFLGQVRTRLKTQNHIWFWIRIVLIKEKCTWKLGCCFKNSFCRKFIQLHQHNLFQNTIGLRHYRPLDKWWY